MANKEDLKATLELAKRNISEFKDDARQARGNMGGMLDNLAEGMKNLHHVIEGLVERLEELGEATKDDNDLDELNRLSEQ